jgi:hypothetical protein
MRGVTDRNPSWRSDIGQLLAGELMYDDQGTKCLIKVPESFTCGSRSVTAIAKTWTTVDSIYYE